MPGPLLSGWSSAPPSTTSLTLRTAHSSLPSLSLNAHLVHHERRQSCRPSQELSKGSISWQSENRFSAMKPPTLLTEAEFEALPFSIQRKYFSSLERLRIAENSAPPVNPPKRNRRTLLISPLSETNIANGLRRQDTRPRRRLRKPQSILQEYDISQAEAQWFLSLPDKVRRRHFSREEQVLLAGRCDTFLPDFEGEPVYEYDEKEEFRGWSQEDETYTPTRGRSIRRSSSIDSSFEENTPLSQETDETFIHFDEMPLQEVNTERRSHSRRSSFRRTLSLTAIPFTRQSTSSVPPSPIYPTSNQPWRPRASSLAAARTHMDPTIPAVDPQAKYYQDPEARMKLRQYLASPQKFDEAIEFGFPSNSPDAGAPVLPKPELEPIKISRAMQTFLRDDTLSFLESNPEDNVESDEDSMADLESPMTPSDVDEAFRYPAHLPSSNFSSLDSAGLPSLHVRQKTQDQHFNNLINNREMTLRMTLTRPDLRADDDALYGWQLRGKDDPLALEELPVSDDTTGRHGPFSAGLTRNKSVLGRFLDKVKKRR